MTLMISRRAVVRLLSLLFLAVVLAGVAGACDGPSGTYQGGGDSEPWFR